MLTRLKVSGFKNLVDVDVYFGPFTCIAGANGVGKSNLFDAIRFLSALSDQTMLEAASRVRDESGRNTDARSIFHRMGNTYSDEMSFVVEMIIPPYGVDDLGQRAEALITFLRYSLTIRYRIDEGQGPLEIVREELKHINITDAPSQLRFEHSAKRWRDSAVQGRRTSPFLSTESEGNNRIIKLHQEGKQGNTTRRIAANLPRTVLSILNATESPTGFLARQEMRSWRMLQLEPSALRLPDKFHAPRHMGTDGAHLPATLYHLAHPTKDGRGEVDPEHIYAQVANRLAELIGDVRSVYVDEDEKLLLYTLFLTDRNGTTHSARSLSDGTLRFLALSVLSLDPLAQGVLCLEEPENGIHPERIPAMLRLLQDIAVNTNEQVGEDNPLRQVIVNTHSPEFVKQVPDDSLLGAEIREVTHAGKLYPQVRFLPLPDTWRTAHNPDALSKRQLLAYLNPEMLSRYQELIRYNGGTSRRRRVMDRDDLQPILPGAWDVTSK